MDHFHYKDGALYCEDVPMEALARAAGTPLYVYSKATLLDHYRRLTEAFAELRPLVCFSIKSCSNLSICRTLGEAGAGMDLVSGGELHRAIEAGIAPQHCVYAGVGKTDPEIEAALEAGVGWFNVESEPEFETLSRVAARLGRLCRAALRINPDVDPQTHRYTTTGTKETKFGVDIERARAFFATYGDDEHCRLSGIHLHIGSPVLSVDPYVRSLTKALALMDELTVAGHEIDMLDLGGGFGADYETSQSPVAADYAEALVPLLRDRVARGLRVIIEPGRTIAANAGVLLLEVVFVKTSGPRTFVICDAGMNALMRPSHYGAFHFMWPCRVAPEHVPARRLKEMDMPGLITADVVGPICETGDFLAQERKIPPMRRGDLLAVFSAGAYGMTMASRYNSMPLPAEVLVDGTSATIIRQRETYEDLTAHERRPRPLVLSSPGVTPAAAT